MVPELRKQGLALHIRDRGVILRVHHRGADINSSLISPAFVEVVLVEVDEPNGDAKTKAPTKKLTFLLLVISLLPIKNN